MPTLRGEGIPCWPISANHLSILIWKIGIGSVIALSQFYSTQIGPRATTTLIAGQFASLCGAHSQGYRPFAFFGADGQLFYL